MCWNVLADKCNGVVYNFSVSLFCCTGSPFLKLADQSPVLPVLHLHIVLCLLALLEQHLVVANSDLVNASVTHPMYGIILSVRGAFESVIDRYGTSYITAN